MRRWITLPRRARHAADADAGGVDDEIVEVRVAKRVGAEERTGDARVRLRDECLHESSSLTRLAGVEFEESLAHVRACLVRESLDDGAATRGVETRAMYLVQSRQLLAERRLEALQGVELVVEASHLGVLLASSPGVAAFGGVALRAADALDRVGVVAERAVALLLLPRLAPSLAELVLELGVVLLDGGARNSFAWNRAQSFSCSRTCFMRSSRVAADALAWLAAARSTPRRYVRPASTMRVRRCWMTPPPGCNRAAWISFTDAAASSGSTTTPPRGAQYADVRGAARVAGPRPFERPRKISRKRLVARFGSKTCKSYRLFRRERVTLIDRHAHRANCRRRVRSYALRPSPTRARRPRWRRPRAGKRPLLPPPQNRSHARPRHRPRHRPSPRPRARRPVPDSALRRPEKASSAAVTNLPLPTAIFASNAARACSLGTTSALKFWRTSPRRSHATTARSAARHSASETSFASASVC